MSCSRKRLNFGIWSRLLELVLVLSISIAFLAPKGFVVGSPSPPSEGAEEGNLLSHTPSHVTVKVEIGGENHYVSVPYNDFPYSGQASLWCQEHVGAGEVEACGLGVDGLLTASRESYQGHQDFFGVKLASHSCMPSSSLIVIDDFVNDPVAFRNFALNLPFTEEQGHNKYKLNPKQVFRRSPQINNHPYARPIKLAVEEALGTRTVNWEMEGGQHMRFQLTLDKEGEFDSHCIHSDESTWAGIMYLTPEVPEGASGTTFYKHKESGRRKAKDGENGWLDDRYAMEKWERVNEVGNVFNRLVLFDSSQFHRSSGYFGDGMEDGRLILNMFFDICDIGGVGCGLR